MAIGDLFGGLISDIASELYDEIPVEVTEAFDPVTEAITPEVTFQPFTVTSGVGSVTGGPQGTVYNLSGQQQALQDALMGQALSQFTQGTVGVPSSESAGLAAMSAGRNLLGQPTFGVPSTEAAAQQAFGAGSQFLGAAGQQPADINALRGQFAGQVGGLLSQQPSPAISQFGQQALSMGQAGLGASVPDVSQTFSGLQAPGVRDVSQAYAGIQSPGVRTAAGQLASRGLGLGMAGLETQAPADVEAMRRQYGGLASQAAMDVLTPTSARESSVYERIRATQRPEEERQRLALEERMAQQGRLGVRTAMFGGAPEQFALAQAQEEAQDRASLSAMQQAQAERQQALGTAQTLGGMFGQQAGLSSQLQSQQQQRATQLSQLGLGAEQIQAQLESEGFGRQMQLGQAGLQAQQAQAQLEAQRLGQQMQLGQAGIGAAQAQSALQSQAQQRASQLSQLGLSAQQIESRLQSEGLGRATTAASQAGQMAQLAGGLQAQQAGLGSQFLGLGSQLASQRQAMDAARQQQALQALTTGQGLLGSSLGLERAQQDLGISALQAGYAPQSALLSALSPALNIASMSDVARRQQGEFNLETQMANINAELARRAGLANLYGGMFSGAVGAGGQILSATTDIVTDLIP